MKDRNTDFHLAEASLDVQTSKLPSLLLLLSFFSLSLSLASFFSFLKQTLPALHPHACPELNSLTIDSSCTALLNVLGQPLPSFSSGFGSRLGRVIKSVASSYTTRLETNQVCCSTLTVTTGKAGFLRDFKQGKSHIYPS